MTLTGLNEATKYTVAVKAGTVKGFGDPGPEKNGTTLEDGKCLMSDDHCPHRVLAPKPEEFF